MRAFVARRPLATFAFLAYAITWAFWVPVGLSDTRIEPGVAAPWYVAGLLGPLIAAFVVTSLVDGRAGVRALLARMLRSRVGWRWWAFAVGSPLAALLIAAAVLGPPDAAGFGLHPALPAAPILVVWLYAVVVNGLGEEVGWRGFALPHLQRRYRPLPASLVLALLWAAWHLPVLGALASFDVLSGPGLVPVFTFGLVLLSVVLTWLFNGSGGSVLVTAVWHGTYNMVSATAAAQGDIAVVVTVLLMAWAVGVAVVELRAQRRGVVPSPGRTRPIS